MDDLRLVRGLGMTQQRVARLAGVSRQFISSVERGLRRLPPARRRAILKRLEVGTQPDSVERS